MEPPHINDVIAACGQHFVAFLSWGDATELRRASRAGRAAVAACGTWDSLHSVGDNGEWERRVDVRKWHACFPLARNLCLERSVAWPRDAMRAPMLVLPRLRELDISPDGDAAATLACAVAYGALPMLSSFSTHFSYRTVEEGTAVAVGARALGASLSRAPTLRRVTVRGNVIDARASEAFIAALSATTSVVHLKLEEAHVTGIRAFAPRLAHIERLWLYMVDDGDDGHASVAALTNALAPCARLTHLGMNCMDFNVGENVDHFLAALPSLPRLQQVFLIVAPVNTVFRFPQSTPWSPTHTTLRSLASVAHRMRCVAVQLQQRSRFLTGLDDEDTFGVATYADAHARIMYCIMTLQDVGSDVHGIGDVLDWDSAMEARMEALAAAADARGVDTAMCAVLPIVSVASVE